MLSTIVNKVQCAIYIMKYVIRREKINGRHLALQNIIYMWYTNDVSKNLRCLKYDGKVGLVIVVAVVVIVVVVAVLLLLL